MTDVKLQKFVAGQVVPLDGMRFTDCVFEGCQLSYNGGAVKFKKCSFSSCSLLLGGSLAQNIEVLRYIGFDLVAAGKSGNALVN